MKQQNTSVSLTVFVFGICTLSKPDVSNIRAPDITGRGELYVNIGATWPENYFSGYGSQSNVKTSAA